MKTKLIKGFDKEPPEKFNNEYPTSHGMFRAPWLMLVCGVRNSGKGYLTSKIIRESNAENLYDVIYFITPTWASKIYNIVEVFDVIYFIIENSSVT